METLTKKQTGNLSVANLYCSIDRTRDFTRNLVVRLEGLEGEGIEIIGFPNIEGLREAASIINRDLQFLNPGNRYNQIINERDLTYTIVRKI